MQRRDLIATGAAFVIAPSSHWFERARPQPSAAQLRWQRDERALFVHFTVNTFTGREWGDGTESPQIFNPTALEPSQWTRVARSAAGRQYGASSHVVAPRATGDAGAGPTDRSLLQ